MDEVSVYAAEAVFTAHEACHYISISRPTLIKLITDGKIRAQKIGRGWRILRAEIDRFLRGGDLSGESRLNPI
jgi:excisionase family DNA binding protein